MPLTISGGGGASQPNTTAQQPPPANLMDLPVTDVMDGVPAVAETAAAVNSSVKNVISPAAQRTPVGILVLLSLSHFFI